MAPAPKRRKLNGSVPRIEDLTFDPSARQEYLTGFHKRKQARIQNARDAAAKREKEDRIRERKQLREQRKEELEQHIQAVNAEVKKQNAVLDGIEAGIDGEEYTGDSRDGVDDRGFGDFEEPPRPEERLEDEAEYVDEDKYTTVTVEPMGLSGNEESENEQRDQAARREQSRDAAGNTAKKKRPWGKDASNAPKSKHKKFRYESKAERAMSRQKQKTKNRAAKARRQNG